jgi:hypothetical protein
VRFDDLHRRRRADLPHGNAPVLSGREEAAVRQRAGGIHGALVKAQHLQGRPLVDIPEDGGLIETPGDRRRAVGGSDDGAHGPAVPAELRLRGQREGEEGDGGETA